MIKLLNEAIANTKDKTFLFVNEARRPLIMNVILENKLKGDRLFDIGPGKYDLIYMGLIVSFHPDVVDFEIVHEKLSNHPEFIRDYIDNFVNYRHRIKLRRSSAIIEEEKSGDYIKIDRKLLFDVSCFLLASSHLCDEGRLPSVKFESLSHDLAHQISEKLNSTHEMHIVQYDVFDRLWASKNQLDKELHEFFKEFP